MVIRIGHVEFPVNFCWHTGYTVWWRREADEEDDEEGSQPETQSQATAWDARGARLTRLACGSRYRVQLRAHSAAGASPHSPPLFASTQGDRELFLDCPSVNHVLEEILRQFLNSFHCTSDITRRIRTGPIPPASKEFVWVNATAMRLNVAAWAAPASCPLSALGLAMRASTPLAAWRRLQPPRLDQLDAVQVRYFHYELPFSCPICKRG